LIRLDRTYSFSFASSVLDLLNWTFVAPSTGSLDLTRFIGDQPLHIVVYDLPTKPTPMAPDSMVRRTHMRIERGKGDDKG
jgi:hypothetical protein